MTGQSGAARRYARALLDVARESADPQSVGDQLRSAVELLASERALRALLANPAAPARAKLGVLEAVARKAGWSELIERLLRLVVERGRSELLPEIARGYAALWNAERGVVEAEASAAVELDAGQRQALAGAIRKATGQTAEVRVRVDPGLLGGVVLRMGGRTYDGSVRSRLARLRRRMSGTLTG
jgi:F-type H+-transporting ATPase subunit delta